VPDFIRPFREHFDVGREMIVGVSQNEDAEWQRHLEFSHKGHKGSQRER
jgi:hypothetical protein